MNRHEELEIKMDARSFDGVALKELLNTPVITSTYRVSPVCRCWGTDTYYRNGDTVVRHRTDNGPETQALTYKKRKSNTSLVEREEIDLFFSPRTAPSDTAKFLLATGYKKYFIVRKDYEIYWLHSRVPKNSLCIALYDAVSEAGNVWERFLEVEVERESVWSPAQALQVLENWRTLLEAQGLVAVNKSLFEIFKPD